MSPTDPTTGSAAGSSRRVRIVGPGRAGGSVAAALAAVGWEVLEPLGRSSSPDELREAALDADLVIVATPDAAITRVAAGIEPSADTVVMHLAGSLGLVALTRARHERVAALHPLVSMPSAEVGAARLRERAWFAVAGDPVAREIVDAWGGRWFEVEDDDRAMYHAGACIASNHLVALMSQVERVAAAAGVPMEAYLPLARASLENVSELGAAAALTGPAARGDWLTIEAHQKALDRIGPGERPAYDTMVDLARRLVRDA